MFNNYTKLKKYMKEALWYDNDSHLHKQNMKVKNEEWTYNKTKRKNNEISLKVVQLKQWIMTNYS